MVSTNSSQYATDFNNSPTAVDTTKSSPLSLLAKTCEAIGLPDTPSSKKTPKKDENSPGDVKKSDSPNLSKRKDGLRSPRATPKLTDPAAALTAMGLHKGASGMFSPFGLPMGFPMGFPGMLPYPPMPYPSFPIPPFMRCPSLMMGRPCTNPAICTACSSVSGSTDAATLSALAAASTFPGMPPFAYPFMPSTSTAASLPATYQQMLQAAAAASVSSSSLPF
ncbi:unnamed protein product, partial [Mesorhabditis belari]|uniref:Uncharacterized protein n=1 Tax=Mesorhabditis belari TaxID=2138241 RepID=A0AAF3EC44_9BILA